MFRNRKYLAVPRPTLRPVVCAIALGLAAGGSVPVHAFEFSSADGELTGSFDTTISLGGLWRMQDRDRSLVGIANGGTARSVNEDDGNLNYSRGSLVSLTAKATHDLEINYRNFGAFVRASYFYDDAVMSKSGLSSKAKSQTGKDFEFLDVYVRGRFDVGGRDLNVRLGRQVVNWGESTFIQNGINVLNPVNVSRLRIPGSELREGLMPTNMFWLSQDVTDRLSVEATLMLEWEKTKIDPAGTFFSSNDFLSPGGQTVFIGFGRRNDLRDGVVPANPAVLNDDGPAWAPRAKDRNARNSGQYGIALRYFADQLNGTEFGLYHVKYHSRTPVASGVAGTPTFLHPNPVIGLVPGTARYFAEFPEDIKLWGLSFNTLGPWGIALQGEYSYRSNQPLQIAAPELLLAALGQSSQIPASNLIVRSDGSVEIRGYERVKMQQFQLSGTKAVPRVLGADQLVMVGEVGYTRLTLPSGIPFNAQGVFLPASGSATATSFGSTQPYFATKNSWGYRLVARADYPNMIGGATVSPRFAFSHDVKGRSPTFNEGAKAITLGLGFNYQQRWQADIAYTNFFGGKKIKGMDSAFVGLLPAGQTPSYSSHTNPLKDRDFLSVSVSYSF
ncbi:DUF1302 domain-containing protein [Pseudothauera lacus]|uniref:DUF1302 domain-containing protein n=1 Tax=Pseudothauera lacus TaxID=2136175 RepID=A0A2T4IDW4_9RHOO|nr:DUF1302 domain-containing protein [Pseudothauera lacus]PTD95954.1 DUF1302 domain-containing protein [Pseudothauera lacus]